MSAALLRYALVRCALAAALAAPAALTGCGDGSAPSATLLELVANLQAAPDSVAHSGLRRFEAHYLFEGARYDQEYTERVWFDGQGEYSIVPDEIFSNLTMPPAAFQTLQKVRSGYLHRYRDFRLVDLITFGHNYSFETLGQPVTFLDRSAWQLEVQRKLGAGGQVVGGGRSYLVTTDVETGLVLAYEERAANGAVLSRMTYESIDFAPDLTEVNWHTPGNQEQLLDPALAIADQVPFPALVPKALPAGHVLREVATVVDKTGRTWLKTTLTDGLESLFFLQGAPLPAPSSDVDSIFGQSLQDDHVYIWRAGSVTVMQGTVMGFDLIAVGKVGEDALLELLDSALP